MRIVFTRDNNAIPIIPISRSQVFDSSRMRLYARSSCRIPITDTLRSRDVFFISICLNDDVVDFGVKLASDGLLFDPRQSQSTTRIYRIWNLHIKMWKWRYKHKQNSTVWYQLINLLFNVKKYWYSRIPIDIVIQNFSPRTLLILMVLGSS